MNRVALGQTRTEPRVGHRAQNKCCWRRSAGQSGSEKRHGVRPETCARTKLPQALSTDYEVLGLRGVNVEDRRDVLEELLANVLLELLRWLARWRRRVLPQAWVEEEIVMLLLLPLLLLSRLVRAESLGERVGGDRHPEGERLVESLLVMLLGVRLVGVLRLLGRRVLRVLLVVRAGRRNCVRNFEGNAEPLLLLMLLLAMEAVAGDVLDVHKLGDTQLADGLHLREAREHVALLVRLVRLVLSVERRLFGMPSAEYRRKETRRHGVHQGCCRHRCRWA